jgi:hypothetical protein
MRRNFSVGLSTFLVLLCLVPLLVRGQSATARDPVWPTEAFRIQWQRTDQLVARGGTTYSWYWGPAPRSQPLLERNEEAPGRRRVVLYYDKGRMELPVPLANGRSAAQLSFGRLVAEMVSGNIQLGERRFEPGPAARIPVAGDMDDPLAPTYASFARVAATDGSAVAPNAPNGRPALQIDRAGTITQRADLATAYPETTYATYDSVTGHNIPRVFTQFMAQRGRVQTPRGARTEQLIDPLALIGRPISEAYWADVAINGQTQTVMVQLFERRVLTYNPANPARARVEFGNAGLHYYTWRYGTAEPRENRVEQLVSHFENGEQALNGNYWFSFDDRNDGGTSSAANRLIGPGVWDSQRAMRLDYSVTTAIPFGFAEMALNLDDARGPRDLRGVSAIGFWARGDGRTFQLRLGSAYADEPFIATFSVPGEWTWVELPLAAFAQRPGVPQADRSQALAAATRIGFRPAERPSSGFLDIDDLVLISGATVPPPPPGPTLLSDFEGGSASTQLGTEWFTYDDRADGGSSTVEMTVVPGAGPNGGGALRFRGAVVEQWIEEPYLGMGTRLAPAGQSIDVCDYQFIRISVKTDGQVYRLQLNSPLIEDSSEYGLSIVAPANQWTPLTIPIKLLTPPEQAEDVIPMTVACTQMESLIIRPLGKPQAFQLMVDDVSLAK